MNQVSPAIVSQAAVRRLPRLGLLFLCFAYVLPGFIGREPWKADDIAAFGYMVELSDGHASWLHPTLGGLAPELRALLPYWLGAWSISLLGPWLGPVLASRLPFALLLGISLTATWYAVYYLARSPKAQPVAFAFGGEAKPADYARAIADGGLLALIACLGLAQLSHETTATAVQMCGLCLLFFAIAAGPYHKVQAALALVAGFAILVLSGAPIFAFALAIGCALLCALDLPSPDHGSRRPWAWAILGVGLLGLALALELDLWHWRLHWRTLMSNTWPQMRGLIRLLLWFTWPAWPLALWTLWSWRRQLGLGDSGRPLAIHIALPAWFAMVAVGQTVTTHSSDRSLILALPALAALAAFALPTFRRSFTSLIDWFTLVFFSSCAIGIWVVWISVQTGIPATPAANAARLLPGFTPHFYWLGFVPALLASIAWILLVHWRTGRHREALWKSLVLPAGGATLCWLLLMSIGLPMLDYARSYTPMVTKLTELMPPGQCLNTLGLKRSQLAALSYHGRMELEPLKRKPTCSWLLAESDSSAIASVDTRYWHVKARVRHPADRSENLVLYRHP